MSQMLTTTVGILALASSPLTFTYPPNRVVDALPVVQYMDATRSGGFATTWSGRSISTAPARTPAHTADVSEQELAMNKRIASISQLQDGWLGAGSRGPNTQLTSWLGSRTALLCEANSEIDIVPTADGTVVLEWVREGIEYTAELSNADMLLVADDLGTDELVESSGPLDESTLRSFLALGLAE